MKNITKNLLKKSLSGAMAITFALMTNLLACNDYYIHGALTRNYVKNQIAKMYYIKTDCHNRNRLLQEKYQLYTHKRKFLLSLFPSAQSFNPPHFFQFEFRNRGMIKSSEIKKLLDILNDYIKKDGTICFNGGSSYWDCKTKTFKIVPNAIHKIRNSQLDIPASAINAVCKAINSKVKATLIYDAVFALYSQIIDKTEGHNSYITNLKNQYRNDLDREITKQSLKEISESDKKTILLTLENYSDFPIPAGAMPYNHVRVDATPGFSECKEAMIRGFLTCYLLDKNYKLLDEKKQYENCKFMKFIQDNKITSFKELTAYKNVKKFVKLVSNIHGVSYNNNGYEITEK